MRLGRPSGRSGIKAAGGRVVVAGSAMARRAVKGRLWAVAMRATAWLSMSTAAAAVCW